MSVIHSETASRQLIKLAANMGQATSDKESNLGFGYMYYGLTRLYGPETVVCIGSYRGFSPVCFTLGLADNHKGKCYFIDPGLVDGYWHNDNNYESLDAGFGLSNRMIHIKKTTQEVITSNEINEPIDILFIDGDHSYEGVKFDFDHFGPRVRPGGLLLLHDAITEGTGFTKWEVKKFLEAEVYDSEKFEYLTIPFAAGLAILRKTS